MDCDDAQHQGGRPGGPRDSLHDEVGAQRLKTRALEPQRRAASDRRARSGRAPDLNLPVSHDTLDAALWFLVAVAQAVVTGAGGVSITLPRHDRPTTVAASDGVVLELDHAQYGGGAGPSLDATAGRRVYVDSLADETRWPAFVPTARARGVETILSLPLITGNLAVGALTVYSYTAGSLTAEQTRWAELFTAEASTLLAPAQSGPDEPVGQQIREALQAREVLAHAQGVIMHRDGVSAAAAAAVLRDASHCTGIPLRDVAARCVASIRYGAAVPRVAAGNGRPDGHPSRDRDQPAVDVAVLPTSGQPIPPAPARAELSPRQPDGTIYVTVDGDWSQATAGTLRAVFDRVRQHRPTLVIADLTDVAVMDIGGAEALAAAARNLESAGCRLELHNPPAHVRAVLDSGGLATAVTASDGTGTHRRPMMGNW